MQDLDNNHTRVNSDFVFSEKKLSIEQINNILNDRALRFGYEVKSENEDLIEMIVFSQAGVKYAVPLEMLSETRIISKMTFLPMIKKSIMGVINVRGRIVAIYSLSDGIEGISSSGFVLVGHGEAGHIAIWAEDIIGTSEVLASDIRNKPISLSDKEYIRGVGSDGMIYLDLDKFISNKNVYMA